MSELLYEDEGCWWMDLEPYPGPPYDPTPWWKKIQVSFNFLADGIYSAMDAFQRAFVAIDPATSPKPVYSPYHDNAKNFDPSWDKKKRREHALRCAQNRNTGPTPEWGFNRDGTRT